MGKLFGVDWSQIGLLGGDFADFSDFYDSINTLLCILCVICAGLAAGLTMGLLSLDVTKLEIKAMTGSPKDRLDAEAILPIVKNHHLLLVTLLLFNSMANEALPVFLSQLVPEWLSVLISVTLILLFGEILPSAFFTGKAQLRTAASMIPFVKGLTNFLYPLGYPLSKGLDFIFGAEEETSVITRAELGALVYLQNTNRKNPRKIYDNSQDLSTPKIAAAFNAAKNVLKIAPFTEINDIERRCSICSDSSEEKEDGLSLYEINIMTGILKLSTLLVKDSMIGIKNVFMISDSTRLDIKTLESLWNSGFSRIPVFKRKDKQHFIGYLLIKSLILISADDKIPVEALPIREPFFVRPGLRLIEMLAMFREGRCHLALVTEDPIAAMQCMKAGKRPTENAQVIGIVTLEDVIEEILQGEINDETDVIPSIFPNGGRSTSAMGILSMGRSSMMAKTKTSMSIAKDSRESKLVKRTVNTHSAKKFTNAVASKRNSPVINKDTHTISQTEQDSRKSWQERCNLPDNTPLNRNERSRSEKSRSQKCKSQSIEDESENCRISLLKNQHGSKFKRNDYSYGALSSNDYTGNNVENDMDNDMDDDKNMASNHSNLSKEEENSSADDWTKGTQGYRIIKNTLLHNFDDVAVEDHR